MCLLFIYNNFYGHNKNHKTINHLYKTIYVVSQKKLVSIKNKINFKVPECINFVLICILMF